MPDPSSSPNPTGPQPRRPHNDAQQYVHQAPVWWDVHKLPKQVKDALGYLLTFCSVDTFAKKPVNGVLLYGPPGTGKTSVAVALAYHWGRAGHFTLFQDFGELMVRIRSSWRKDAQRTVEDYHNDIYKPQLLVLDDVGKRATPEDQETISVLVNGRINRGKPTVLTTNCDLGDLNAGGGKDQFMAAADSRVLERYSGIAIDAAKFGENLRRKS